MKRKVGEWERLQKNRENVFAEQKRCEEVETLLTSELLSNHQKKVNVLVWLGQTTAVRLASFPLMATIGAERYTRSTGPEVRAHTPVHIHTFMHAYKENTHTHTASSIVFTADVHLAPGVCACSEASMH